MSRVGEFEVALEAMAAAWLAGCAGFAVIRLDGGVAAGAGAGLFAGLLTYRLLAALREQALRLPAFAPVAVEQAKPDQPELELAELELTAGMQVQSTELLLTCGQMLAPPVANESGELVLDDVLAKIDEGSRVVQLFDPSRMPTAGELKSRIDRHLGNGRGAVRDEPQQDASQALYDALADLRRSLA